MDILLTDKEMRVAYGIEGEYGTMERVCQAQLKKVAGWGDKHCLHQEGQIMDYGRLQGGCPKCWQALKKEVGI